MQEQTVPVIKEKNPKPLIIFLLIISTLSIIAIGFLGFLYAKEMKAQGKTVFNIDGVNPEIANQLSGTIVYSSDKTDNADYFSPALEITFKYNQNLLSVADGVDTVYISPVNWGVFNSAYLKITPTTDIKGSFLSDSYYLNLKFVEEIEDDGIHTLLFSYDELSLLDETKKTSKTLSVIYKQLSEQSTAYIEIAGFDVKENEDIHSAFRNILKTISTDISEINQELEAQIASGTMSVKFDRSLWSISYQSEYYLSLSGAKGSLSSANFSVTDVYDVNTVKDSEALKKQLNENIAIKQEYYKDGDKNFEIVGDIQTVQIDGINFEKATVKYDYGYEPSTIETLYIGFLEGAEKQIDISTRYYTDQPEDEQRVESLIKGVTFTDDDIYSMNGDNVLGESSVSINKATILGQASTVRIFSKECNNVTFSDSLTDFYVQGKTYEICGAGFGSGFVVNGEGYIVTNAHVANENDLDALVMGGIYNQEFLNDFGADVIEVIIYQLGEDVAKSLTDEEFESIFITMLADLDEQGYISYTNTNRSIYVQGDDVFDISETTLDVINTQNHFSATLVDNNEITSSIKAILSEQTTYADVSDLALIKVEDPFYYPSIPINSTTYTAGQEIYVIGYPGVADNSEFFSSTTVLSSTVTKGTISAIKPTANNSFDLLQIDASVQHGNSGGPIIDLDGNVIGVATYGLSSESGNYNAGISGEELQKFLDTQGINLGINSERNTLESALSDISLSYYSRAKEKLEDILSTQESLNVILLPFVELCDSKIANGEDKTPLIDFSNSLPLIIFVILILLLIVAVTILIINIKEMAKRKTNVIPMGNIAT